MTTPTQTDYEIPARDASGRRKTLEDLRARIEGDLQSLVNNTASRGMTDNEERRHDEIRRALETVRTELRHQDEQDADDTADWQRRRGLTRPGESAERLAAGLPPYPNPPDDGARNDPDMFYDDNGHREALEAMRRAPLAAQARGPMEGRRYEDLFGRPQGGAFRDDVEFMRVLSSGRFDPRLVAEEPQGHGYTEGRTGGFLSPDYMSRRVLDTALEMEIVRARATVYPMPGLNLKVPGVSIGDHSSGAVFGGVSITWLGEGGTIPMKKMKLRVVDLRAHKAGILTMASNEIEADTMIGSLIGEKFPQAVAWGLDDAFLNGNGVSKPLGALNAENPSLVVVPAEAAQESATIVYENLTKMLARLHPAFLEGSVWLANSTTLPQLLTLSMPVGTGGSHIPVLNEGNTPGKFTMLTRPVIFSEKVPALGEQGDISLVNFSQYLIGMRKQIRIEPSVHAGFQTDETAYRLVPRVDGRSAWDKPFTPKNGDTQSWIVTLEERA